MITLKTLVDYCNDLLRAEHFQDYCPNGLQVEGRHSISKIVSGVTANQALIDAAIEAKADLLLVHHGYFWKGENPSITGMKQRRLKSLLAHDMNLLAYHLPLDAHPELGNNAQLALQLGLTLEKTFAAGSGPELGCVGQFAEPLQASSLVKIIQAKLGREPQHIAGSSRTIQRVGWCTGAAQSYFEAAIEQGVDAFISGEISEPTVHLAREYGVHYFAAGHHATERYGVQALGKQLADQFDLEHHFVDIDNPV